MYGLFEEGLSIGDFLKKNIPDDTPITITSEENYQYESYIKDWEEFFLRLCARFSEGYFRCGSKVT